MKTLTKTMLATAALMVAAGVASAQSFRAEVPFAFQAGGKTMTPGTYQVDYVGQQHQMLRFANLDAGTGVVVLPTTLQDPARQWVERGAATIAFACTDAGCELREVWTGNSGFSYRFKTSQPKGEETRMAYITLHKADKAD